MECCTKDQSTVDEDVARVARRVPPIDAAPHMALQRLAERARRTEEAERLAEKRLEETNLHARWTLEAKQEAEQLRARVAALEQENRRLEDERNAAETSSGDADAERDAARAEMERLKEWVWGGAVLAQAAREDALRVTRNAMSGTDALERQVHTLDAQAALREFHSAFGLAMSDTPTVADEATRVLRCRLLLEEVLEYVEANGYRIDASRTAEGKSVRLTLVVTGEPNLTKMAHELGDILYVTMGAAVSHGVPLMRVFRALHEANMRKVGPDGQVLRREDGKVLKPEGWQPADIAAVLKGGGSHGRWALENGRLLCRHHKSRTP